MKSVPEIADVVELRVWADDQAYSVSALKEDLEAALSADDSDKAEEYAREVFEEIIQRAKLLGPSYPFTCDGATLAPNDGKANSSYLFCLGLSFFEGITVNLRTREFESVVKTAAENYFKGKAVRIGAPWKTGEVATYRELLENLRPLFGRLQTVDSLRLSLSFSDLLLKYPGVGAPGFCFLRHTHLIFGSFSPVLIRFFQCVPILYLRLAGYIRCPGGVCKARRAGKSWLPRTCCAPVIGGVFLHVQGPRLRV